MKKRLQVVLNDDAWASVKKITQMANEGFDGGHITFSDVINEMALCATVDIEKIQLKHTNLRKTLRLIATRKDLDVDAAIASLMAIKKGLSGKPRKNRGNKETQECLSL